MTKDKCDPKDKHECTTIIEKLVLHKKKNPEKIAYRFIVKDTETETMTYEQLYERVLSLAAKIKQKIGHQERVILCAEPGFDFVVGFYACLAAGVVAVPVVPPLNKMMATRFLHILNNVQPQLILFDTKIAKVLNMGQMVNRFIPKILKSYVGISDTDQQLFKALKPISLDSLVIDASIDLMLDESVISTLSSDDLAFIQYTSGSTADPKGVLITHGNLVDNSGVIQRACQTSEKTICYSWLPPYHDMGLIAGIIHMMFVGGTGILQSTIDFIERPLRWLEGISKYRCTMTGGPNFAFELCIDRAKNKELNGLDLSPLNVIANGAEPIHAKTIDSFYSTFEKVGLRRNAILPCYGLAESTLIVVGKECLSEDLMLAVNTHKLKHHLVEISHNSSKSTVLVSSGKPMMPMKIVNLESFNECNESEIGEIWVQSKSVAKGYYNNPAETEKTFHAQIKGDEQSGYYLRTGDLGFLYQGQLYVCGRIKNMIIIRGQNYYPHDIELAVTHSDASIRKAGVVAYASQFDNEEVLTVVAEVKAGVSKERFAEIVENINHAIGQEIHLMAKHIHLVPPRSIPKTTSGKLQRIRCKEWIDEQVIIPRFSYTAPNEPVKPAEIKDDKVAESNPSSTWFEPFRHTPVAHQKNAIKTMVLATIGEIVPLHNPSLVDLNRGFFELGIDSIKAVAIKNRLQEQVGDALLLESSLIFNFPNIQAVIDYLYDELRTDKVTVAQEKPMSISKGYNEDIAIVGMSCEFPGAKSIDEFWHLLSQGQDAVSEISQERWYSEFELQSIKQQIEELVPLKAGCIDGITDFDAAFFSIAPKEALLLDPQQRLLLMNAWRALEDAAIEPSVLRGSNTGVFIGISSHDYEHLLFHHQDQVVNPYLATGNAASTAAGRLSYVLGLEGPAMAIDTACSSSLVALHEACTAIHQEECDLAIVGGVNVLLSLDLTLNLAKAGMLSPDGACKTFDKEANGYVRGEGCGMVVLKRLGAARRDNDRILAVIKGSAVNQDGASSGLTVPNGEAQKRLLATALTNARLTASEVDFIECHGTGTSLGDPIEVGAISQIYGANRSDERPLYLGAVKTNIGHLEAAAGIAGLIKTILMLQHQLIPSNLHFNALNPHIRLPVGTDIVTTPTPWNKTTGPRRAAISSFGFSGTNAHVILEEALVQPREDDVALPQSHVFVLSAKTKSSLESLISAYQVFLEDSEASLADICYTAALGRSHFQWRIACTVSSKEELIEELKEAIPMEVTLSTEHFLEGDAQSAYLNGKSIDWLGYYQPYVKGLRKVHLPTYCFETTRYWLEMPKANGKGMDEEVHPLLGSQWPGYGDEVRFWQQLHLDASDYLSDHRVAKHVILPGASMLESALGARYVLDGDERVLVEELVLEVPMVLAEEQPTFYQVSLHSHESAQTGRIYSSTDEREWVLHAHFRLSEAPLVVYPLLDMRGLQERLTKAEVGLMYERLAGVGLAYGPTFQTMTEAYVGEGEVLVRLQLQEGVSSQRYRVHPTLLDGAFQAMSFLASEARLYIPALIDKVEWFSASDRGMWAHVQLREMDVNHLTADIRLYTLAGVCLANIEGMSVRATRLESLHQMQHKQRRLNVYREGLEAYALPTAVGCLAQALVYGVSDKEMPSGWEEGKQDSELSQRHVVIGYGQDELMTLVQLAKRAIETPPLSMTLLLSGAYGEDDAAVNPWMREALGFWRSVRLEAPQIRWVVIDSASLAEAMAISNVGQHTDEPEIILHHAQAYVPKLYRESAWQVKHKQLPVPKDDEHMAHGFGVESLYWQTRALPAVGSTSLRVRMLSCALNFRDVLKTMHLYPGEAGDLGYEGVGEVLAVGEDVQGIFLGMRVMVIGQGLLAAEAVVDRLQVIPLPSGLSVDEGAALPIVFLTAQHALLQLAQLKKGQRVLIHAAAGGVGLAAIQLAKRLGAEIYATASEGKQGYVRELGIEHVYDSRSIGFAKSIVEATQGVGVDVVLNSLTSEGFIEASLSCLKEHGVFLEIGKINVYSEEQMQATRPDVSYHLIAMDERMAHEGEAIHEELGRLAQLFEDGALRPLPVTVFALQDSIKAFHYLQAAKHIGKVVLSVPPQIHYDPQATYLITGGVGALGRALVEHMIAKGAQHFVLTSRHALDETTQAWCGAHHARGVQIEHAVVDVADRAGLALVFTSIRQSDYPLKGIFHAAGVLHDGLFTQLSEDDFNAVLAPKVLGAMHLDALSQEDSLDYFVMFSSVAGLFGNIGQSNYAAANAYMDGLAKARNKRGLPGVSINFGPFATVGMAAHLAAMHRAQGFIPMMPEEALSMMDQVMRGRQGHGAIMDVQWEKMPKTIPYLSHLVDTKPSLGALYQLLEKTPSSGRETLVLHHLKQMVKEVLQLESYDHDSIDINRHFFEMGFDSLMIVEFKNRIQNMLGDKVDLKNDIFFEYSTLDMLKDYLLAQVEEDCEKELPQLSNHLKNDVVFEKGEHAILLLHGLSGTPLELMYLARHLYKAGFSVEIPYVEGYIFSTEGSNFRRQEEWVHSISNHLKKMKQRYKTVSVGGLSAGATLSLRMAQLFPSQIHSLVLLSPLLFKDGWAMPWYSFLFPIVAYTPLRYFMSYNEKAPFGIKNKETQEVILNDMEDRQYSITGGSKISFYNINEINRLIKIVKSDMAEVTCPTLIIHAIEDDTASIKNAIYVHGQVNSESKRIVVLTDSYHIITADNEKDTVVHETIQFLNGHLKQ